LEPARSASEIFSGYGEGRNRTGDTTVFSRVLYQLSYLAKRAESSDAAVGVLDFPCRRAAGFGLRKAEIFGSPRPAFIRCFAECWRDRGCVRRLFPRAAVAGEGSFFS
jgi:hypothetical protein